MKMYLKYHNLSLSLYTQRHILYTKSTTFKLPEWKDAQSLCCVSYGKGLEVALGVPS